MCLANIDQVYQVNGDKRKKLLPVSNVVYNVKTLQIVCKVSFAVPSFLFVKPQSILMINVSDISGF